MLNKFPLWKNLLVVVILAIAAVYALPNLYGEDYAVQISASRNATVDMSTLKEVEETLAEQAISPKGVVLEDSQILVRLNSDQEQLQARDALLRALGTDYIVALNLAPATPDWLESLGASPMKLGLDLRGGVHFLMEVDMQEAMRKIQDQQRDTVRSELREERIRYSSVVRDGNDVVVTLRTADDYAAAERFINNRYPGYTVLDNEATQELRLRMTEAKLKETQDYAISQNVTILRNRVNELGVAEPLVQRQGAERIVVQLPGVQDTARAKEILGATATLEFRFVDDENSIRDAEMGRVPFGSELFSNRNGGNALLKQDVILTGDHIINATSGFDENQRPQVSISLDGPGGDKMSLATRDNIGKPMATLFIEFKATGERDENGRAKLERYEEVINIATIQARLGSNFRITGISSQQEAQNLALLLRAGALIAPIQIVEERTLGPSLGKENIALGTQAIVWGFLLVVLFMVIYYKKFGMVANLALTANLVLIIGVMSMIPGATLTLPGMAGIVLTVGMAVDANVLIFERIREEIKDKRSPQQAIHHGYDSAFSTILDANITTLIVAIILFAVGTGPVKGFAITLAIGIITSMFTAIVGTRAVINAVWGGKRIDKLSV
ncbi:MULTISPECIES: protein translocase subunit SecD [Idiomarinaceae]|uniref:Protein translocase subunit SecD n=2 Tax=Pseudidiomarina TaxID=2800384 RepID=A0AB39X4Q0_9GAMM|nr:MULTISPECIES: protein translocase subunit SecD [Idiomarinaceae]MDX1525518.1 protein translocase subunit SecD [Pseudidiomarina maritima]NCU57584.1 protein translocase subunit SecD [Idiomarina sp. FenA--70]NCU60136.1 protein translocase subunit SecD [Idiomarina sp. FenBw--71]MDT7525834.1 protein translocase subunit SecD [Pseudidiomarina sp. GXY010]MRJ41594.1 protein translocase subunit SecD [Idiomarina sp. FeN1]